MYFLQFLMYIITVKLTKSDAQLCTRGNNLFQSDSFGKPETFCFLNDPRTTKLVNQRLKTFRQVMSSNSKVSASPLCARITVLTWQQLQMRDSTELTNSSNQKNKIITWPDSTQETAMEQFGFLKKWQVKERLGAIGGFIYGSQQSICRLSNLWTTFSK